MSLSNLTGLVHTLTTAAQYLIIALMLVYTIQSYTVFRRSGPEARERVFLRQNLSMFAIHFLAFASMFLNTMQFDILIFYGAQVIYLLFTLVLFRNLYPRASRSLINNMCMLETVGFIMLTRLSYDLSIRQFQIACAGTTNGAKLAITVAGFSFQPSEFVKIIFVFAVAGLLSEEHSFRRVVIATVLAAVHVLILVRSTDLGSALIFFLAYLVMLFVATRNPYLVLMGILAGAAAAVAAYFLFAHVRVRVQIWQDPFKDYTGTGYQICQSLFAIVAGGWVGTGLGQGSPGAIPYVQEDFMFSAILEELGGIFGICLILVCMSVFIMVVNVAMQLRNRFYRLAAIGLGSMYAIQVFLTIGGGIKLIPMTGVTLPLVSYGGSSVLSTLAMFAIVQGLYMLRSDEVRENAPEKRFIQQRPGPDQTGRAQ